MTYIDCEWEANVGNDIDAFGYVDTGMVGVAIKPAPESNSLSANALRFRMRSLSGDVAYIGYRLKPAEDEEEKKLD